ncbi:MAG: class I SAM-dependent methyltransferase, partial [Bacillota bacterium]
MNNREYFNNIAYKWDEMAVHNEAKLRLIIQLSEISQNASILDVGTGTGVLIRHLLEKSPDKIVAVDIADKMIEIAQSKYNDQRVDFRAADIFEIDEESSFDRIFLYSVYPHFEDKAAIFSHLKKLLKSGGRIIIAHSESKEKINEIHSKNSSVKEHVLPSGEVTASIMADYFEVDMVIDNEEMYFIAGIKR